MSFNAKNLSYDSKDPPFLQRLKGHYGTTTGRLERPIARPRKQRQDDEDDEPTYVDEESNEVISKEEYKALVQESNQKDDEHPEQEPADKEQNAPGSDEKDTADTGKDAPASKQNVAEIGGPKKRKQAKVVGEDNKEPEVGAAQREVPAARKPKQKKKKIKLSFDEEE
ncbi:hypothetical protein SI65_08915 [Aspergillus cristatus]|uniref:DUF4604 domain-containing protein n=1 Tax=Aspergillus cristatus TaxID=573508 RepID=A0A1E3B4D3_ASPCR|nr:hypothetical protein SI65_08915 [Aspergillus cristatus]